MKGCRYALRAALDVDNLPNLVPNWLNLSLKLARFNALPEFAQEASIWSGVQLAASCIRIGRALDHNDIVLHVVPAGQAVRFLAMAGRCFCDAVEV